jgi:hypothetical protein
MWLLGWTNIIFIVKHNYNRKRNVHWNAQWKVHKSHLEKEFEKNQHLYVLVRPMSWWKGGTTQSELMDLAISMGNAHSARSGYTFSIQPWHRDPKVLLLLFSMELKDKSPIIPIHASISASEGKSEAEDK